MPRIVALKSTGPMMGKFMKPLRSLAERECLNRGFEFPSVYKHQFVISSNRNDDFEGWEKIDVSPYKVHHCKDLPICTIRDDGGDNLGVILGYAIDSRGTLLSDKVSLKTRANSGAFSSFINDWVNELAGRFVILISTQYLKRFYLDPSSSLGAVYCTKTGDIGGTVPLILERELSSPDGISPSEVRKRDKFYLFGKTADSQIKRPVSNHYIDLETMTETRHWPPVEDDLSSSISREDTVKGVAEKLHLNIRALSRSHRVSLPITGGKDSRILLSAAMPNLDEIDNFYAYSVNWSTQIDALVGAEISKLLGLNFRFIGIKPRRALDIISPDAVSRARERMILSSGFESNGISDNDVLGALMAPKADLLLRGGVLEMTRAHIWGRSDIGQEISTERGLIALKVNREKYGDQYDEYIQFYEAWRDSLPNTASDRVLDFSHTELWLPSTAHVQFYAFNDIFFINPFNDRYLIDRTSRMPLKYKKNGKFVHDIIAYKCPDLANFPYHKDMANILREGRFSDVFMSKSGIVSDY